MSQQRFKRYRMEVDLAATDLPAAELPEGYCWIPWRPLLSERHALVKWRSFRNDLDGQVFECLRNLDGCRRLISEISRQPKFCTAATWMIAFRPDLSWPADDCGTIQGIARSGGIGAIQNVGVTPEHRRQGLGRAIVLKALEGFWNAGLTAASLEVTADNRVAVKLYETLGFRVAKVLYRDAERGKVIEGSERPPNASERLQMPAGI